MSLLVRRGGQVAIDLLALAAALALAFTLRFDWDVPTEMLRRLFSILPYVVVFQYLILIAFSVPKFSWRYFGLREAMRLAVALGMASTVLLGVRFGAAALRPQMSAARYGVIPIGVIVIDLGIAFFLLCGVRVARRLVGERTESRAKPMARSVPTIVVGAGGGGLLVAKEVQQAPHLGIRIVGFVDDDPAKKDMLLHGIPVLGSTRELPEVASRVEADQALIAIASAAGPDIRRIAQICESAGLPVKIVPGVSELVGGKLRISRIRDVAIQDLLRRAPVELDEAAVEKFAHDRIVAVTGAGGSIGSEMCRQVCRYKPSKLVLMEHAENALFHIHRELSRAYPDIELVPKLVDICDAEKVEQIFSESPPHIVLHAAAYKHVPMLEWNADEAVVNNVGGSRVVAEAAGRHGAAGFVMISTDKAVRPSSVMGASKRVAELYVQSLTHEYPATRFAAVRFGNVLGSDGSVVPIFREQISKGGPVTVTHPEMRRYFMTIPEACQLVLQAGTMGRGGEVFILDMGEPVKILDLAEDLIRLSGLVPGEDIEVEFCGMRPGEKLFEELSSTDDLDTTTHPKIFVERSQPPRKANLLDRITVLEEVAARFDDAAIRHAILELVPDYTGIPEEAKPRHSAGA